jgi:leader peptidase (prepilin peptidase)/N-methyltransferase
MDWIWPVLAAPFVGSFLGVLILRLPEGRPVALARSACDNCGTRLAPIDLVPLLSYARLRGRCRHCGAPIAPFHWQVELAALAVALSALAGGTAQPGLWLNCLFGWTLLALAWVDWDSMLLPDVLTLPLIPAGLLATLWLEPELATDHALAAAIGYTVLRGLALLYRKVRGREGLGEGDAKLLAALGAWVGLEQLPLVVLVAALAGLVAALLMALRGRDMQASTAIPFGPFLALAGWVIRLIGGS